MPKRCIQTTDVDEDPSEVEYTCEGGGMNRGCACTINEYKRYQEWDGYRERHHGDQLRCVLDFCRDKSLYNNQAESNEFTNNYPLEAQQWLLSIQKIQHLSCWNKKEVAR